MRRKSRLRSYRTFEAASLRQAGFAKGARSLPQNRFVPQSFQLGHGEDSSSGAPGQMEVQVELVIAEAEESTGLC